MATNYFTKWVEVQPLVNVSQADMIMFIKTQIIYRFEVLETITTNQGTMFIEKKMKIFAQQFGFQLVHSSPYYTQANRQAEASNKVLIDMTEKTMEDKLRWHEVLFEVLWAYKNSKSNATGLTPYWLTYGKDAVLPLELAVNSFKVAKQHELQPEEYSQAMFQELESVNKDRLMASGNIQANKAKV